MTHDERRPLRGAPAHGDEQADIQEQQYNERRDLPEQVQWNELEPHEEREKRDIASEQEDDHGDALLFEGMSTYAQINAIGHSTKPQMSVTQPPIATASAHG